jgi:hypothetical protein
MEVNLEPKKDYNPEMHTTEHILNQTMMLLKNFTQLKKQTNYLILQNFLMILVQK